MMNGVLLIKRYSELITQSYYSLPHDLRRFIYSKLKSEDFQRLQTQRTSVTKAGYSLIPFIHNKCIFVHIPKAAGVSVCEALFQGLAGGHKTIKRYQAAFSKQEFDSFFKFTFVRNPWSRLYSAYHFLQQGGMNALDKKWASEHVTRYSGFNEFVSNWVTEANVETYMHFVPQYRFLCLPGSDKLEVNFLGLFENLHEDFDHIKRRLSLPDDVVIRHQNKTESKLRHTDYRDVYSDEAREIVADVYRKDIRLLGYNFDNSSLSSQLASRPM